MKCQKSKIFEQVRKFCFLTKAQAAMEFLMTYGWAVLVVLAAIAALAYFGVLSPEKFLPEKCTVAPGIACIGHKIEPAQSTLVLSNGMGKNLFVDSIQVKDCLGPVDQDFDSGTQKTFTITNCDNGDIKSRFSGDIIISYAEKDTNLTRTMFGSLTTKVE